jgi:colanic acid/amylovoran biosynthesis protein
VILVFLVGHSQARVGYLNRALTRYSTRNGKPKIPSRFETINHSDRGTMCLLSKPRLMNHPMNIVLLWHSFESGNLGVGALSIANTNLLVEACESLGIDFKITLIGHGGELSYLDFVPPGSDYFRLSSMKKALSIPVLSAIRKADIVIDVSEGDSFTDIYGLRRLLRQSLFKFLALWFGRPLVLAPQTLGPFNSSLGRWLGKRLISRCHLVCTRDTLSTNLVRDWCEKNKLIETTDVAFGMDYQPPPPRDKSPEQRLKVGLNVSALLWKQSKLSQTSFGLLDHYDTLIMAMLKMLQEHEVEIHLIPHVLAPNLPEDDDLHVCEMIAQANSDLVLPKPFTSPVEAKEYIANLDLLIGARMHATIAALSTGVPVLPLAYSRKFTGLYDSLDYPYVADLTRQNNLSVLENLEICLEDLPNIRKMAAKSRAKASSLLDIYRGALSDMLTKIGASQ